MTQHLYCSTCRRKVPKRAWESVADMLKSRYCNRSCAAKRNNRIARKRNPEGACRHCGGPCRTQLRYCTRRCRWEAREARIRARRLGAVPAPVSNSQRVMQWRKQIRERVVEYMGGKCCVCGYSRCARALHCHHVEPENKSFGIADGQPRPWRVVKTEMEKCILVCANCHTEIHHGLIDAKMFWSSTIGSAFGCYPSRSQFESEGQSQSEDSSTG